MKLNNKGFALTSIIYMLIVLFLMIMLLVLSNLAQRKAVLDKLKNDVKIELNQGVNINSSEHPYQNTRTKIYYETLNEAFDKASAGDTIKLMRNIEEEKPATNIKGTTTNPVILDLNGNTIDYITEHIINNGALDIYSSIDGGTIVSPTNAIILNNGNLTLNGTDNSHLLSIINNSTETPAAYSIINNSGTATLNNNVTLEYNEHSQSGTANRYVVTNNGTITINGATLINKMDETDKEMGITNTSTATTGSIIVNSGTIETSNVALWNNGSTNSTTSNPAIKIAGGTLRTSKGAAVINSQTNGMIYITGGEIYSTGSNTIVNTGNLNISGGTIYSYAGLGIDMTGTSTLTMSGGTIIKEKNPVTNEWNANSIIGLNDSSNANISGNSVIRGETGWTGTAINVGHGTTTISGNSLIEVKSSGVTMFLSGKGKIKVDGGTIKSGGNAVINSRYASSTSTNYGIIEINGGTIQTTASSAIQNTSAYGRINITGGTIQATASSENYGTIYNNKANSQINISGGTITSGGGSAVYIAQGSDNTTTTMTGGELQTTGANAIYNRGNGATVTIGTQGAASNTYPKITGRIYGDGATDGSGLITVNSGTITGTSTSTSDGIYSVNNITVNGGVISSSKRYGVISDNASSKITINGGTITSSASYAVTTANAQGGEIEINGGTIRTTGNAQTINNHTGNTVIKGGTIECTNNNASGVYSKTGTITIGINDGGMPSQTIPSIKGGLYGVNIESGTFNFYDGKITGASGKSVIKEPTNVPSGYTRKIVSNGTTDTTTLGWATDSNDTLLVDDSTEYYKASTLAASQEDNIKSYTINAPFAANEVYQLEADIKGVGEMWTFFYGASGYWPIANVKEIGGGTSTRSDGGIKKTLPNDYTHYELRFTLRSSGNANINKYVLFRVYGGNTAYIKNVKFYKINSANITINPNGGTYNGSTATQNFSEKIGNQINIANPTRSGYTFGGWLPTKQAYDATWAEVFYHNSHTGTVLFSNASDWAEAKSTDGVDKYSILGQLEKFRANTSQTFEFLLDYDELANKYNRWRQTANPATTTVANGDGSANAPGYNKDFTGAHLDWTGNYWGGLAKSTSDATFINGSVGHGNWFYAIGAKQIWGGNNPGIPGPNGTNINEGIHLWVKVNDDLSNITQAVTGVAPSGKYTTKHDITLKAIWIPN